MESIHLSRSLVREDVTRPTTERDTTSDPQEAATPPVVITLLPLRTSRFAASSASALLQISNLLCLFHGLCACRMVHSQFFLRLIKEKYALPRAFTVALDQATTGMESSWYASTLKLQLVVSLNFCGSCPYLPRLCTYTSTATRLAP